MSLCENQREMKTLTEKIVDRLEAEAVKWSNRTAQCEALFMAAKIVAYEFAEEEKEMITSAYNEGRYYKSNDIDRMWEDAEEYYNETFKTK
jgi:hypothetical protein